MARMFPERLPDTVSSDAEYRLFDTLKHGLDNDYTVYAGVRWLRKTRYGAVNGEADFIITHPERGLLVLEVKGGGISVDGVTGTWYSRDRYGDRHVIKNPVEQAQNNFYDVCNVIADAPGGSDLRNNGGHAVVFPDSRMEGWLGADLPREILIDAIDLDNVQTAIDRAFSYWSTTRSASFNPAALKTLQTIFARSWDLPISLAAAIRQEGEQFRRLTEQQFGLLDFLSMHNQALIAGCAGSGKTMLAAEKARRLAGQGFNTLLTCYNKNLANWLRKSLAPTPPTLRIQHFHELAHEHATKAGLDMNKPQDVSDDTWFREILPEKLLDATAILTERFDAIIVDEGQDFSDEWWVPLQALLTDPDKGIWYIFYDDEQRLYTEQVHMPFEATPYRLTNNLRTTCRIHDRISQFYDMPVSCLGPEGRPVTVAATKNPEQELRNRLHNLINVEKLPSSSVVILTPASQQRSSMHEGKRLGNLTLTWSDNPGRQEVRVSTIHGFKGLESPVVIVTEMDAANPSQPEDRLKLVGWSRARNELIIIEQV